ncbi:MAG: hypothetical protein ACK5LF_17400 [Bacteroides xylanisolvens]
MKTNNQTDAENTECKFFAQICYDTPIEGVGSIITTTADEMCDIKQLASYAAHGNPAHITIKENKKKYPQFDWVVASEYDLNK